MKSTLNPALTLPELGKMNVHLKKNCFYLTIVHHFNVARPTLFIVHLDCLSVAVEAANVIDLSQHRFIVLDTHITQNPVPYRTLQELVEEGSRLPPFIDRPLREGEAKKRVAFLAPSSGTTGLQKVRSSLFHNRDSCFQGSSH